MIDCRDWELHQDVYFQLKSAAEEGDREYARSVLDTLATWFKASTPEQFCEAANKTIAFDSAVLDKFHQVLLLAGGFVVKPYVRPAKVTKSRKPKAAKTPG